MKKKENSVTLAARKRASLPLAVLLGLVLGMKEIAMGGLMAPTIPVVINEFMAANTKTIKDEDGQYDDWIELYNPSASSVNLDGYYLSDTSSQPAKWMFPVGTTIAGKARLLIWADGTSPPNPLRRLHASFRLNGTDGEMIGLYEKDGATTIDVIRFGQQAPDVSYGRLLDGLPTWGPFRLSTPRTPNGGYAPPPAKLAGILFINEWLTSNTTGIKDASGKREDWFELYNSSEIPIDLGGYYLTDDLTQPKKWLIPPGNVVGHRGFALFWADDDEEEGPTHTNFKLKDTGEALGLFEKDGVTRIDSLPFGRQKANVSQGRKPDGAPTIAFFAQPTPRGTNVPPPTLVHTWRFYR